MDVKIAKVCVGVAVALALVLGESRAETYRLRYQATVDVLDDSGAVVGQRKLKAGSIVELPTSGDAPVAGKSAVAGSVGKLVPSKISNAMFQLQQPPRGATFRAELRLSTYYVGQFDGQEVKYWAVDVDTQTEDWGPDGSLYGYAPKSLDVGKRLSKLLGDGKSHRCVVHVVPVRDAYHKDIVKVDDFEEYDP